MVDSLEYGNEP